MTNILGHLKAKRLDARSNGLGAQVEKALNHMRTPEDWEQVRLEWMLAQPTSEIPDEADSVTA